MGRGNRRRAPVLIIVLAVVTVAAAGIWAAAMLRDGGEGGERPATTPAGDTKAFEDALDSVDPGGTIRLADGYYEALLVEGRTFSKPVRIVRLRKDNGRRDLGRRVAERPLRWIRRRTPRGGRRGGGVGRGLARRLLRRPSFRRSEREPGCPGQDPRRRGPRTRRRERLHLVPELLHPARREVHRDPSLQLPRPDRVRRDQGRGLQGHGCRQQLPPRRSRRGACEPQRLHPDHRRPVLADRQEPLFGTSTIRGGSDLRQRRC